MSNDTARLAREWATSTLPKGDAKTLAAIEHIMATTKEPTMADVEWDDEKHHLAGATTPKGHDAVMMWCDEEDTGHIVTDLGEWRPDQLTPNGKKYELREVVDRPDHTGKTMDEYSPEERAGMVGMWAGYNRHEAGGAPDDFVIITGELNEAGRVPCYNPLAPSPTAWAPDLWMLTPRFDIPRAWGTDGNPELQEATAAEKPEHPETLTTVEDYENAPVGTVVEGEGKLPWTRLEYVWKETAGDVQNDVGMAGTERRVLRWGWVE